MRDSTGPFDDHVGRRLIAPCEEHGVPHRPDTFRYCRSDAASAFEAGLELRTAWWASASTPRTATSAPTYGIRHVTELLALYPQT